MDAITHEGLTYGDSPRAIIESLFTPGPTHAGHYVATSDGYDLYDMRGEFVAHVDVIGA